MIGSFFVSLICLHLFHIKTLYCACLQNVNREIVLIVFVDSKRDFLAFLLGTNNDNILIYCHSFIFESYTLIY